MLTPTPRPYSTPPRPRRERKKKHDDNLLDGAAFAIVFALLVGGLILAAINFAAPMLAALAVIAFVIWCLRWAIRIW